MNSLSRSKTAVQSAAIRASVEESNQRKALKARAGWHTVAAQTWAGRGGRRRKDTSVPGPSWWCTTTDFYGEAKQRQAEREAHDSRSFRAPDELGMA